MEPHKALVVKKVELDTVPLLNFICSYITEGQRKQFDLETRLLYL